MNLYARPGQVATISMTNQNPAEGDPGLIGPTVDSHPNRAVPSSSQFHRDERAFDPERLKSPIDRGVHQASFLAVVSPRMGVPRPSSAWAGSDDPL